MAPAILRGAMEIPIGSVDFNTVRKELTVAYRPMGAEESVEVKAYVITKQGTILVPRQYGIDLCNALEIPYEDKTSGGKRATFPRVPEPRAYQVEPLAEIYQGTQTYYDFIARARTGWGKTIGALIIAARLKVSTVILVDQENLKDQWVKSLQDHFGFAKEDIGIIQGNKCSYEGKAVTIAMVQTLSQRLLPSAVYAYFGLVIVDEVHIIGAPTFHKVLLKFPATYRFGVSATPKRRDGLQKLLDYNLGEVRVYVEDEHDPSAVYVMQNPTVYSAYANKAPKIGRFINEVTEDGSRNLMLAEAAAYLYDTGRDVLVLSDRIEQLEHLQSLCFYLGIPPDAMGVYAGYGMAYGYDKDAKPVRRPEGYERGTEYTPISLTLISKRKRKQDLERIKTTARIIFATYGKFAKGVDEPRLSGGMDASPRSTAEQINGRILRKSDGKQTPIWITTCDTASYRSMFSLAQRIPDYVKNKAVVSKWSLEKGKTKCHAMALRSEALEEVKRLKSMPIETNRDGLNTLQTREQQMRHGLRRASDTMRGTDRRRASPMASSRRAR